MTQLMPPDLTGFRWIVINSSSGKDSATALRVTVQLARQQGVPMERLVVSHQCLGTMEWKGAAELAQKQAEHYGLRFEISRYRNKAGVELTLLEYIRKHGKWPDSKNRYCTKLRETMTAFYRHAKWLARLYRSCRRCFAVFPYLCAFGVQRGCLLRSAVHGCF